MEAEGSALEIEVKLRAGSLEEAAERLARLPATLEQESRFEDNEVFDTPDGRLTEQDQLLRLRVVDGRGTITHKMKVATAIHAKVREEVQTSVGTPEALREILLKVGFARIYRYQKYRSYHGWSDPASSSRLSISLDDTPIGVYIELEGDKIAIDHAASRMGYGEKDYIVDDYRTLHLAWLEQRGLPAGDMVFA